MIISHTLGIIFIKTRKVAGTSFEIALSKYCGSDCIITPITPEDEQTRIELGFRKAQNYEESNRTGFKDPNHVNHKIKGVFYNHMPSKMIYNQIDRDIFDNYKKISIQREPLDFLISQYFWRVPKDLQEKDVPFKEWGIHNHKNIIENYLIAPKSGKYACDTFLSFENFKEDIERMSELPSDFFETFSNINAKGTYRDKESRNSKTFFKNNGFLEEEIDYLISLKDVIK